MRSCGQNLIQRLREGPLQCADYAQVAKSRQSLKVRVHQLRDEGFVIETHTDGKPGGAGRRPSVYTLLTEPGTRCLTCGGRL